MLYSRHINWMSIIDKKRKGTDISIEDHNNLDTRFAKKNLTKARSLWKEAKTLARINRDTFLADRADELAVLMKTNQAKALKAIRHA
jgi:hypothetical protein